MITSGRGSLDRTYSAHWLRVPPYPRGALTHDLNCTGDGLQIADPGSTRANLTLNLAGHSIKGNGTGTGVGAGATTLTITDGTITGFGQGIFGGGRLVNLARVKISRTASWMSSHYGGSATVMDSRFVDAGPGGAEATSSGRSRSAVTC